MVFRSIFLPSNSNSTSELFATTRRQQVADDAGVGVAHSNIGLCYGLLGDYSKAAQHHQEALRVSLRVEVSNATLGGHFLID